MKNRVMNFIGKANYTGDLGTYIWGNNIHGKTELIAMIEGYREIQELCTTVSEANEFQDEMGRFIAEAINEKIERDRLKMIYVSDLDISVRLYNCFKDWYPIQITYLDQLSNYTNKEVFRTRNFGKKTFLELKQLMEEYNIKFKGE